MTDLIERIRRAHGGARWEQIGHVMACVNMGGWDFTSRLLRPLCDLEVTAAVRAPQLSISPYPRAGCIGHFTPGQVWIEDDNGRAQSSRHSPAEVFRSFRHWVAWDELDVLYYAGLLLWHTLNLPALLVRGGLALKELEQHVEGDLRWHRLGVTCPEGVPALASEQVVFADAAGLVRRLDYRSSAYGGWMGLTQLWDGHQSFGGLVYPTRLTLHPRLLSGQVWRLTSLAWLELDDISVVACQAPESEQLKARGA
jgi:hypothetical protein